MSYIERKLGERKSKSVILNKGPHTLVGGQTIEVTEEMSAWMVYEWVYEYSDSNLGWHQAGISLEDPNSDPDPEPKKLSWWRRLFYKQPSRLPEARVKESDA